MFRSSLATTALLGVVALMTPLLLGSSASAAESHPEEGTAGTAGLWFQGYDAQRAAEWGYEVRTDADGWQYAVPTGTPEGSLEGASPKFNPATSEVRRDGGEAGDDETVDGDCGTASLDLTDNTHGTTGYDLNGAFGAAISHTWGVTLISSIDAGVKPLDGTPQVPAFSFDWEADFTHDVQALGGTTLSAVAGGTVTTVLGSCRSGSPHSAIVYR